jgi:hypothetical protein
MFIIISFLTKISKTKNEMTIIAYPFCLKKARQLKHGACGLAA